ncbi:inhibitor of apoptosis repeat-containing protein [Lizonia empirigonia]|nr:inhibitor of apoptosis repeat-containing protein [Lizonia empirigonia]
MASLACLQARIDTFAAPKSRRTSSKTKKPPSKTKHAWPRTQPSPHDLAFAGFVWKPTTASPDNVQCFSCHCQLDGWEENDVPAYEHLTHSPSCGFAVVTCIRLRIGDPGKSEEDPVSDAMMQARRDTFADSWPLDSNDGFPSIEQLVEAGWYYDPTLDTPDGATCAYCSLSLDAWDVGDDPMEEHRRRAPDCLFFALKELYHPPAPVPATNKGKRASTRTSIASTASKTRGKKRTSEQIDDTISSRASTASTATKSRSKKRTSDQMDDTDVVEASPKRIRYSSISSLPDSLPVGTPKRTPAELAEAEPMEVESVEAEIEDLEADISSLPASLLVGTPKKTPTRRMTPEHVQQTETWDPIDMDAFLGNTGDVHAFINDVVIDAGLDAIVAAGAKAKDLQADVLGGLTQSEKEMTVEQWVLYNAKRGEEKLRQACGKQILAFEAEALRARAAIEGLPTC